MRLQLCGRCAEKAKDAYRVQLVSMDGRVAKCDHCGRKKRVCEHEVTKKDGMSQRLFKAQKERGYTGT